MLVTYQELIVRLSYRTFEEGNIKMVTSKKFGRILMAYHRLMRRVRVMLPHTQIIDAVTFRLHRCKIFILNHCLIS